MERVDGGKSLVSLGVSRTRGKCPAEQAWEMLRVKYFGNFVPRTHNSVIFPLNEFDLSISLPSSSTGTCTARLVPSASETRPADPVHSATVWSQRVD